MREPASYLSSVALAQGDYNWEVPLAFSGVAITEGSDGRLQK